MPKYSVADPNADLRSTAAASFSPTVGASPGPRPLDFWGTAALASAGVGAGLSTVSAYYGAKAQQSALRFQADIAETNMRMAELDAQSATLAGQREQQRIKGRTQNLKASQRTAFAANGVDMNYGSALNILLSTDIKGEIDAHAAEMETAQRAQGYRAQGTGYRMQAIGNRSTANSISPGLAGLTSALGSSGQVAQTWYMMSDH